MIMGQNYALKFIQDYYIIHSLLLERQSKAVTIINEPGLGPLSTLLELVGLHQLLEVLFIESESGGVLS